MTDHLSGDQRTDDDGARGLSAAAGLAFASLFRVLKLVRPVRPIHPNGTGLTGRLVRTGSAGGASGLDWLDAPGTDAVEARFSRSIGLPKGLPDILGLALRVVTPAAGSRDGGPADILFASTGWRVPGRFLLQPRLEVSGAALTTLMPYRGRRGPVLLGLQSGRFPQGSPQSGEWILELYWARPLGPWQHCGELRLRAAAQPQDTSLRFDPLANLPPGAHTYPWTRRLRERSYLAAQRQAPAAVVPSTTPADQTAAGTGAAATERKPMATVSQVFNSPAADVWKVIADGWLYSGWVVGASRIRAVDDHWPHAGSRLHHSVGAWPFLINDSTSVTTSEPNKKLELVARGWPLGEAKVVITLEEDQGGGCKVTMAEDAIRGPGKRIPKFLRDPMITVRNRETLKRLELMAAGGAGK
ncbi:hypothetical protein Asphe3_29350 [Pseudarthrobacter phenanthrenivorans Sphe3]|uniref:SRPBCC family protein n=2 Tax=Pseudarthrobacter phenanthrenivorans TaxID=361575 RepID=F0MBB0_PSEPM|nr:SRPBCC family protein [Pseudarthrobacter phenanthrenivorans]ADX74047.1 hypothetical protein Asphe3_29350 [Pseudarthrobacter phenanthrenivorans Sphe3]